MNYKTIFHIKQIKIHKFWHRKDEGNRNSNFLFDKKTVKLLIYFLSFNFYLSERHKTIGEPTVTNMEVSGLGTSGQ